MNVVMRVRLCSAAVRRLTRCCQNRLNMSPMPPWHCCISTPAIESVDQRQDVDNDRQVHDEIGTVRKAYRCSSVRYRPDTGDRSSPDGKWQATGGPGRDRPTQVPRSSRCPARSGNGCGSAARGRVDRAGAHRPTAPPGDGASPRPTGSATGTDESSACVYG